MKRLRKAGLYILTMFLLIFVLAEVPGAGSLTVQAAAKKPGKPAIVSVTNTTSGIVFKWKKASDAKGYYVYRRGAGEKFSKIATLKSPNTVSYTDKSVKNKEGVVYVYTVRAYNGKLVSDYVTGKRIVRRMPASIKLNKTSASIKVGASVTLKATVTGSSKKVTWTSSNTKVAAVQNGKVTGKQAGKAVITAKANGKTAKCTVTVKPLDYKDLYKNFLAGGKVSANTWYLVLNIDQAGVPELIIGGYDGGPAVWQRVYTVKNNQLLYLGECIGTYDIDRTKMRVRYVPKLKGIWRGSVSRFGESYENFFAIYGNKFMQTYHAHQDFNGGYYLGATPATAKKVSKAVYASYYNIYFNSKNCILYPMVKNTSANRAITFK